MNKDLLNSIWIQVTNQIVEHLPEKGNKKEGFKEINLISQVLGFFHFVEYWQILMQTVLSDGWINILEFQERCPFVVNSERGYPQAAAKEQQHHLIFSFKRVLPLPLAFRK